jgi:hypothetical protein
MEVTLSTLMMRAVNEEELHVEDLVCYAVIVGSAGGRDWLRWNDITQGV